MNYRLLSFASSALLCLVVAGCAPVGPDYKQPDTALAPEFKEQGPNYFKETDGWKIAQPGDTTL